MGCNICNGTGFVPYKNKQGQIEPHVRLYCQCYGEPEHYQPLKPESFDYAMSYSNYRGLCQQHGWPDPGPDLGPAIVEQPVPETNHKVVFEHSDLSASNLKRLTTLEMQVQTMRIKPVKKKTQSVKSKGIAID